MWERVKRWRWAILGVAALAVFLGYSFYPDAAEVDLGEVSTGPMSVGITDDGVTRIEDVYLVSAPVAGQVTRIEIEPGDRVIGGKSVLARMNALAPQPLDPRTRAELRNALDASRASERSAAAALTLAERTLERSEVLAERGFLARAGLDRARSEAAAQRAAVDRARAESRRITALLSQPVPGNASNGPIAIRAPVSGVILRVLSESEGAVAAGTPLIEIGDPAALEVVIDLLSRDAVQVRPGARVEITNWGDGEALAGRVERIEPFGKLTISALGVEEQRVNVIVGLEEKAERLARLGHGYQLDARVILWQSDNVIRVPIGALFRGRDGAWKAFEMAGGRAVERTLALRHINDMWGEVVKGLEPGAKVILNPGSSIEDGIRVQERTS